MAEPVVYTPSAGTPASLCLRSFSDDESAVERVAGWDLQCLQMSPGTLAGESIDVQLPSVQLLFEAYRQVSTSHCGTAPRGAVVFGIAAAMQGEGRFNGRTWRDGLTAFDARQELVSFVPPTELITLVVDRRRLCEHASLTERVDLSRWLSDGPLVINDGGLARQAMRHLRSLKDACAHSGLVLRGAAAELLADQVLDTLCGLVLPRLRPPARLQPERPPVELVQRAREHLHDHADEPLRIADLCRELGVSRRWLQWSFNAVMGVGPKAYLHLMRLNGARRMLLQAGPGLKVADAVETYGFWHLSRFSRDYRQHFGELPSQTLCRAQARH